MKALLNLVVLVLFVGGMLVWGFIEYHRLDAKITHKIHEADTAGLITDADRVAWRAMGYLDERRANDER